MAKKHAAEKGEPEVIAKCDNLYEVAYSQSDIERMIITIRGVQVMIDRDLATVYGVTTSRLNEQVKRNIARFPTSFRFQLTKAELDEVVANCDNLHSLKFNPSLPYAFTEPGIAQLSSVLHSERAIIHTRYSEQFLTDLKKHNEQYPEITFVQLSHRNHDRFLIVDNKAYLLGASVKDIGTGLCAVTEMAASPESILEMVQ